MDGVALTFEVPSNRTVDSKGTKSIVIKITGHEKTHYAVVLVCYANKRMIWIFNRKTLLKGKIPSGIIIHIQEDWMDEIWLKLGIQNMGKTSKCII